MKGLDYQFAVVMSVRGQSRCSDRAPVTSRLPPISRLWRRSLGVVINQQCEAFHIFALLC